MWQKKMAIGSFKEYYLNIKKQEGALKMNQDIDDHERKNRQISSFGAPQLAGS